MFSLRNKKNVMRILPLICSYVLSFEYSALSHPDVSSCKRVLRGLDTPSREITDMKIFISLLNGSGGILVSDQGLHHLPPSSSFLAKLFVLRFISPVNPLRSC